MVPSAKDMFMVARFRAFLSNSRGATAIEYGLIAVAAIGAMSSLGSKLGGTFNNVKSNMR